MDRDKLCPYGFKPGSGRDSWAVDQITALVITVGADLVSARPQEGKRSEFAMDKDPKTGQGVWLVFDGLEIACRE